MHTHSEDTSRARRGGSFPRRVERGELGEQGASLIAVMAVITAVLLVGAALLVLGTGESDIVEYGVDDSRAFYLAEGGVDRARTWLEENADQDPPVYPGSGQFTDQVLGSGEYDVDIQRIVGPNPWVVEYDVVSTAVVDGVVRQIHAVLRNETFAQYMYFADHMEDIWFISGDSLDGRVHANGFIRLSGSPWFGMKVTTAQDHFIVWGDNEGIFEAGYELGVPQIPLPVTPDLVSGLAAEAASGGLYAGGLNGSSAKYQVELGRNGNLGYLSYRKYERVSGSYQWSPWSSVAIDATNGIAWFEETVEVKGVLDGMMTIGSAGDIRIIDDVVYEESVPGQGPVPGGNDILGLVAAKNIVIAETPENYDNCEIHAHMMALDSSFTAERYWDGPPRGDLIMYGGFAQETQGAVGQFSHGGTIIHGYQKDYNYDTNLLRNSPPGYPPTGKYLIVLWEDVYPPIL